MNAFPSNLMAFSTTNFYFVFLLDISSDWYKPTQLQCTPMFMFNVHLNKQVPVKIVIRSLELALAAVNYFPKKTLSYLFDSVLLESKKRLDFEKIFAYRITQVTRFIEISWDLMKLFILLIFHKYSTLHFDKWNP